MNQVVVITGGGSGMGLATAKAMPRDKTIVISGRTVSKLENAVKTLQSLGYEAHPYACDTSKRDSVQALADYAASLGEVRTVIHAAGVSPHMATAETLFRINALGTVYVNQVFATIMPAGSVIVDIASNSGYLLSPDTAREKDYAQVETDENAFVRRLVEPCLEAGDGAAGLAYTLSKNFVIWYAKKCAFDFAPQGIRVCSVSPGLIATPMGNIEKGDGEFLIGLAAEHRMGTPEELAFMIACAADPRNGYLAGVDVLVDGGSVTRMKLFR